MLIKIKFKENWHIKDVPADTEELLYQFIQEQLDSNSSFLRLGKDLFNKALIEEIELNYKPKGDNNGRSY